MSSVVEQGYTRRLRNGKVFAQLELVDVCFKQLVTPAIERDDRVWEDAGEEGDEEEADGICYAGDWSAWEDQEGDPTFASSSAVKLEDILSKSNARKRPLHEPGEPARKQSRTNAKRAKRRHGGFDGYEIRVKANPRPHSQPIATVVGPESLPTKADACSAKNIAFCGEFKDAAKVYTLQQLRELGFRVIGWDGLTAVPILDRDGRVVAVLAGRPGDDSYIDDALIFHDDILARRAKFVGGDARQVRGHFPAQAVGISYGTGQPYPMRRRNVKFGSLMDELLESPGAQRIASYQSASYSRWSPDNYTRYSDARAFIEKHEKTKGQHWNFERSVFAAATVNFGPRTRTFKHRDVQNAPFGWCAVTALGRFDSSLGGHLVLWDLGLVLEFPAGSTILLPSATMAHSNVPVAEHETRTSFTQYSAGALFRWVESGGRDLEQLKKADRKAYNENRRAQEKGAFIERAIARFSTLNSLIARGFIKVSDVS
ncbi:hypothetical protein V5O48_004774 [Marasmius crinis-equi]|uniref:Uncharacterized protein n=1 Tax=Marasmius crinis-equi TaxID=585013 RepID=A0ABR3FPI8_9AGAR